MTSRKTEICRHNTCIHHRGAWAENIQESIRQSIEIPCWRWFLKHGPHDMLPAIACMGTVINYTLDIYVLATLNVPSSSWRNRHIAHHRDHIIPETTLSRTNWVLSRKSCPLHPRYSSNNFIRQIQHAFNNTARWHWNPSQAHRELKMTFWPFIVPRDPATLYFQHTYVWLPPPPPHFARPPLGIDNSGELFSYTAISWILPLAPNTSDLPNPDFHLLPWKQYTEGIAANNDSTVTNPVMTDSVGSSGSETKYVFIYIYV